MSNDAPPIEPMVTEVVRGNGCGVMAILMLCGAVAFLALPFMAVGVGIALASWFGWPR